MQPWRLVAWVVLLVAVWVFDLIGILINPRNLGFDPMVIKLLPSGLILFALAREVKKGRKK